MKIALVQINAVVGDFPGNAKRILAGYREALEKGAELVVTPEMSLVGYPPRDLVFKSQFVPKCLQALDYLKSEVGAVPLLVGYVDRSGKSPGRAFRNAVAWLEKGQVRERIWKTLLPTYDVFDEWRYFEPGEECRTVMFQGKRIGVTICEDIWTEDFLYRPLYERDPVHELEEAGADVIVNLSASPFALNKPVARRDLFASVAKRKGLPLVYCNAVGGQDQLIFDGHSAVVDGRGGVIASLAGFREEVAVVDVGVTGEGVIWPELDENEQLYEALVLGLRDYVTKCGFEKVCLGLSGGIDSALTAALAVAALGAENVRGLTMPSAFSSAGSVSDSEALARNLGMRCEEVPIGEVFAQVKEALQPVFGGAPEDVTEENMQARIRGLFLMSLSNKTGALLLTTGNKSELAVGYCTMYGDMCGGLAAISDLPKTRVYELARWINRDREIIPWNTIDKPPSAELAPDQKDQDSLPPYEELDAILELYVEQQMSASDIIECHGHDETIVRWVQRRVDLNEWKRHQAAPGLRVTSKAFGVGRRMPIVQNFQG
ncbi:NAD+ synthase [Roseibacillus ishigakijimensis]|uniref:Glutamine-dependent NAD(+) synthetase n=1 Tax=Roseibacillus ishigakijimensis TaxID=454146 RepID=A0A934RJA9_9BACT|nr:NAD+ synthase [Roseibacillus ishigakijimensis]MBK1832702.1 NAD+ synthase [Roseibacillus ishigakijimensis]